MKSFLTKLFAGYAERFLTLWVITLRSVKGSALTHAEMDANFTTLRDVASQTSGSISGLTSLGVDGQITATKASGFSVKHSLVQTGVSQWDLTNIATSGNFTLTELGVNNWLTVVKTTGVVGMAGYGVGTATFDSGGNISSVSDENYKIKDGEIINPASMLMQLKPGYFFGKPKANMGPGRQLGFYAQNVRTAIGPEAAPDPEKGKPWGYYDRSVLAVAVEALKTLITDFEAYRTAHP